METTEPAAAARRKKREKRELMTLIEDNNNPERAVSWMAMEAGVSSFPRRKFCVICGFQAASCCRACYRSPKMYFRPVCSVKCDALHKSVDCGKPYVWNQ